MNKYHGLSTKEVINNRHIHGSNNISRKSNNSLIKLFITSLGDPIIKILLIALGIKIVFLFKNFDWYETIGIVIAVFIAALISSISEYGAENAFDKLQDESSKIKCKVIRNSIQEEIIIDDIVYDDLVILESGDKVPADGIIIEGSIYVDESLINGESDTILKKSSDFIYRGSVVCDKRCLMKATKIGFNSEYGKIANELLEKSLDSPLKLRLRHLAKILSYIGYIGAFLVFIAYLFSKIVISNNFNMDLIINTITNYSIMMEYILYALTLSVTIIVVAVPEGLPMMITLVLSSNMKKLIKRNVLVRKLEGIETAGNINILYTDKTGTITTGNLEVKGIVNYQNHLYYTDDKIKINNRYYDYVYKAMVMNNECIKNNNEYIGGNNTDKAIRKFIKDNDKSYQIISKSEFNSNKKYSKVTILDKEKEEYYKGSPELIIKYCNYYLNEIGQVNSVDKKLLLSMLNNYEKQSFRVLALAYRKKESFKEIDDLIFIGFVLIKDEIRPKAIEGINNIKASHINITMITGDSKETALAIGREVGIFNPGDIILDSSEIKLMTDDEIKQKLLKIKIIARALPSDKSRLVKIAQEMNLVVGMTGDGVNDAPALKKANSSFAMGSGSEVAKEASDIVIIDNNINSIAESILFGRTIFKSIRKFIVFQITINICALGISIIGPFINVSNPVTVMQMLWVNMIMDTLAAVAFSYEPTLKEYIFEQPKNNSEPIINKYMYSSIFTLSIFSTIVLIFILKNDFISSLIRVDINDKYLYTVFFATFIFMGIFNALNARTERVNILANINKNMVFIIIFVIIFFIQLYILYYGGSIFRSYGLTITELLLSFTMSFLVIPLDIIRKIILRKNKINRY